VSFVRLQGVDRSLPIWVASALALVVLMALPIGWIAALSVGSEAGPTLGHYRRVFADPALQKALWNTIVLAFWVGLASLAVGAPLATFRCRNDDRHRPGMRAGGSG
jgi:ABC-type Fe3+ transport system permease subunit